MIIGVVSLVDDVVTAVGDFMKAAENDPDLRARIESRIKKTLALMPISGSGDSTAK